MENKATSGARSVDLRCPRCRALTVRYWPDYDSPGDVLACPTCAALYELSDGRRRTLAPIRLDDHRTKRAPERSR